MGDPEIYQLITQLKPLAALAKVEDAYWISTPDGEYRSSDGAEWCFDCGNPMVKHLRKNDKSRRDDYILDGGWVCEHETPPHCAHCGVKLRASLLVYGGIYELEHFRENPPEPGSINHAYEVSEMLSAFEHTKSDHEDLYREAIEIGRALVAGNCALSEAKETGDEA